MSSKASAGETMKTFPLAPMSPLIRVLTYLFLLLPILFVVATFLYGAPFVLAVSAALLVALYAAVWLWWRPSRFDVGAGRLSVVFPLRRLDVPLADVVACRALSATALRREIGWGVRIGVGGLWGGFGRLLTKRRGSIRLFVSRTDRLVLVERRSGRSLLLTPAECDGMVSSVQQATGAGAANQR
jgi:hypothetical protein